MKHIVVTGSTRGIGFGLAEKFLKEGCRVTINGTGARIEWLTSRKIMWRFLMSPFRKRDLFKEL